MKAIFLFITIFIATNLSAQVVFNARVLDKDTNEPIAMVLVSVSDENQTYTNQEGYFQIQLDENAKEISFSNLNYNLESFDISEIKNKKQILLEPTTYELEEVLVTNVPLKDILKGIYQTSKKNLDKSLLIHTYYREFIERNDKFTKFSDGLLDYYIKKTSGKSDLVVEQSRSFALADSTDSEFQTQLNAISFFDVRNLLKDCTNFDLLNQYVLKNSDSYNFYLKQKKDGQNKMVRILNFEPKEDYKDIAFEGYVTYDLESNLIVNLKMSMTEVSKANSKEHNFLGLHFSLKDYSINSEFKIDNQKYIPMYNKMKVAIWVKYKTKVNDVFGTTGEMATTSYEEKEVLPSKDRVFKEKSLYKAGTHFTTEFWKNQNAILPTIEEAKIIETLK